MVILSKGGVRVRKFYCFLIVLLVFQLAFISAWAAKEDCGDPPNAPAKPVEEVDEDNLNTQNDYVEMVEESKGAGFIYLTFINGDQPKPNACGLNPSNDPGLWTGWGGPLDGDNVTIGEGAGTRNEIVIGGIYFERGIGCHAVGTIVYDLTGEKYVAFEAYVGMSDEKDPAECGNGGSGDFIFTVDGKEMFKSDVLKGSDAGENVAAVKVEFDIPSGAKEMTVVMGDGGDGNSCDHSAIGDAKLLTALAKAVEPGGKAASLWGRIKASY